jgi:hypothetical protein
VVTWLNDGNRRRLNAAIQPAENRENFNASRQRSALYTMARALLNLILGLASRVLKRWGAQTRGNFKATAKGRHISRT